MSVMKNILDICRYRLSSNLEQSAKDYVEKEGFMDLLEEASSKSGSTGVSWQDCATLHWFIRERKPQYFLECGTGVSTHIIAKAMRDYCYDAHGGDIKLISMESEKAWYDEAMNNFPQAHKDFLEIQYSPLDYFQYAFIRGTVYTEVPDYPYDMVFVDGPATQGMCNMDFIRLLERSEKPVAAIIDDRKTTVMAYQSLLGSSVIHCYPYKFSYIEPVTKNDLLLESKDNLRKIFSANIKKRRLAPFLAG